MSEQKPLIGVTTSEVRDAEQISQTPEGEPKHREMALGLPYLQAIEAGGGLPVVMPPLTLDAVGPLLSRLDGVCLSGGPDLDPAAYRARRHPEIGPIEPELDVFELAVASEADVCGLPILAICRGAQALNIARGGTLHQHLPDRVGSIQHRQSAPGEEATHTVEVVDGSKLAGMVGTGTIEVNSFHHQAVSALGVGLRTVAWAPDGVIEGIEAPARPFVVGVQWHAESLTSRPEHAALFAGLVEAGRRFRRGGRSARAA